MGALDHLDQEIREHEEDKELMAKLKRTAVPKTRQKKAGQRDRSSLTGAESGYGGARESRILEQEVNTIELRRTLGENCGCSTRDKRAI